MISINIIMSTTDDVVEERMRGLRRERVDEVEQFSQQKYEFVLFVSVCELLEENAQKQGRLLHQTIPNHLLRHRTHYTKNTTRSVSASPYIVTYVSVCSCNWSTVGKGRTR